VLRSTVVPLREPFFPPLPHLMAREHELRALAARLGAGGIQRLALIGGGGTGKSVLACALGHRLRRQFPGGIHWFRVGAWDTSTLFEILARRLGVAATDRAQGLREAFAARGRAFVVLDNHESDRALARFLEALRPCPVTWLITARRCLLSGVEIFPVVPPLATVRRAAFPRVAGLTELLRWNPLALDIADRLVASRAITAEALARWLVERGIERIAVRANEDDVAEVHLLVDWAWQRLGAGARRMLAVLAHTDGDDVDAVSLAQLAGVRRDRGVNLRTLRRWHLVQEPLAGRFTVHAVVRQAVAARASVAKEKLDRHYLRLLERHPERVTLEQTHLFAAMDGANRRSDLREALRIERLLTRLDGG
jgi:hypothetical protein